MDEVLDNGNTNSNFFQEKSLPNSTAILVLGIISIVTCWLYAVPGIICGIIALSLFSKDKKIYQQNPAQYSSSFKNAKAGQVCAIIGLSLSGLMLIYFLVVLMFIGSFVSSMGRF